MERISTEGVTALHIQEYIESVMKVVNPYDRFVALRIERLKTLMEQESFDPEEAIFIINTINVKLKK